MAHKSERKTTAADAGGDKRIHDAGVYIPDKQAKARMEESARKRKRAHAPRHHRTARVSTAYESSEPGSLIGGIRASGIKAVRHTSSIPEEHELTEEERHEIWQPPLRDTSRFRGSSSSRHRSSSSTSYSDSIAGPGGSLSDNELSRKERNKARAIRAGLGRKNGRGGKPAKAGRTVKRSGPSQKMFRVRSEIGKQLYNCKFGKKSKAVLDLFEAELPAGSYRATADGIQLAISLSSLGFRDEKQFNKFCAHALSAVTSAARQTTEKHIVSTGEESEPPVTSSADDAMRHAWAEQMVGEYYEVYGPHWSQWRRLVPWLDPEGVRELAAELGSAELWSDKDREAFLHYEGFRWSVWELNTLITYYPLWHGGSPDWELDLPGRSATERRELATLLNIPSVELMRELARVAAGLNPPNPDERRRTEA